MIGTFAFVLAILVFTALSAVSDFKEKQVPMLWTGAIVAAGCALFTYTAVTGPASERKAMLLSGLICLIFCFLTNLFRLWGPADGKALFGGLAIGICLFQPEETIAYLMLIASYLLVTSLTALIVNRWSKIRETEKGFLHQTVAVVPGFFVADVAVAVFYLVTLSSLR